ncbi:serine/threonine protein kinase [Wenzhouxiangella sp. AB-CW3]|uniref:serine/threonine protein kinase n=1 Tax=Wenzhouxiangella sp. AB-CW3 TaxID=2771012 RepID=UPI00168AEAE1|nr:serine/threonine protein kinase [Wenzhouxiangella sp. AB-CW3]QOC21943.1 serine/threonine protein kinase [Wenzhouxiangella sp. AB-CW3]
MSDPAPKTRPFAGLDPGNVLDAIEQLGLVPDGRLLALGSYENRVWQVGLEDKEPVVVKFYRPERWSDSAIEEEHQFAAELAEHDLPVVAPTTIDGRTLHHCKGFRLAVFPRRGGHAPEPAHEPTLRHLGRVLGRMHAVGATRDFQHRERLDIEQRARAPVRWLLDKQWLPLHLEKPFQQLGEQLLEAIEAGWERAGDVAELRLHGDCHPGNILWRDDQAHFVDLDDCLTGPAIQDLWMLVSGEAEQRGQQLGWLLEEYRRFHDFDARQLHLIEPLRTMRMIYYQFWLARRWDDPAFPAAFPWFGEDRHWENVIQQLKEQLGEMSEPPPLLPERMT